MRLGSGQRPIAPRYPVAVVRPRHVQRRGKVFSFPFATQKLRRTPKGGRVLLDGLNTAITDPGRVRVFAGESLLALTLHRERI